MADSKELTSGKGLIDAIREGNLGYIKKLIHHEPTLINMLVPPHMSTVLHEAVNSGNVNAVNFLVKNGARCDATTVLKVTPLHLAAQHGRNQILMALVHHIIMQNSCIDLRDRSFRTPLHYACENSHADCVRTLLDAGADGNVTDDRGLTPLHLATQKPSLITQLLLQSGADPTTEAWTEKLKTPIDFAIKHNCRDNLKLMLNYVNSNFNNKQATSIAYSTFAHAISLCHVLGTECTSTLEVIIIMMPIFEDTNNDNEKQLIISQHFLDSIEHGKTNITKAFLNVGTSQRAYNRNLNSYGKNIFVAVLKYMIYMIGHRWNPTQHIHYILGTGVLQRKTTTLISKNEFGSTLVTMLPAGTTPSSHIWTKVRYMFLADILPGRCSLASSGGDDVLQHSAVLPLKALARASVHRGMWVASDTAFRQLGLPSSLCKYLRFEKG